MRESRSTIALSLRDEPHVAQAARTLAQDSGITVVDVLGDRVVVLGTVAEAEAVHRWRIVLLNERLVADADEERRAVLAALIA